MTDGSEPGSAAGRSRTPAEIDLARARTTIATALALGALAAPVIAAPASARKMVSTQLGKHLCRTSGGGKIVKIPGFPGEKIDRRLLPDIHWMVKKYHVFITDGYSTSGIHASGGEHPIGLATDLVPYKQKGGSWDTVASLHRLAEPKQNHPKAPWRWVGWNGDPGHGRGNHLHLSWSHNAHTKFGHPAKVVYTRKCPDGIAAGGQSGGIDSQKRAAKLPARVYRGPANDL